MIELRTFGHTELTAGEDGDADALIAQSKRFALFCYLALPKPGILHRRDTLLGVFWPETDQEHSRLDLRQALAFIRKTLGEDVLLRRGDHEVGLNPDIVWCDAAAFQQAVEQREWAEAVELYQGDFLKGFFLSNEAEFEPWLDGERARLAGAYRTALEEAANSAVSDGHGRRAVEYCERLVEQDRYNSRYAMKLMEALAAVGDPANALLCAERHAELLQEEFDIAPPPELQALAEQIRQESATVPLAGRGQSAEEVLPPSAAPDSPSATVKLTGARQLHTPKRGWKVALATGAVAAVLAATVTVTVYSRESSTALDPSRVAVAVFRHATGDPSLDHVGERAAHWITQGLQQAAIQKETTEGEKSKSGRKAIEWLVSLVIMILDPLFDLF